MGAAENDCPSPPSVLSPTYMSVYHGAQDRVAKTKISPCGSIKVSLSLLMPHYGQFKGINPLRLNAFTLWEETPMKPEKLFAAEREANPQLWSVSTIP